MISVSRGATLALAGALVLVAPAAWWRLAVARLARSEAAIGARIEATTRLRAAFTDGEGRALPIVPEPAVVGYLAHIDGEDAAVRAAVSALARGVGLGPWLPARRSAAAAALGRRWDAEARVAAAARAGLAATRAEAGERDRASAAAARARQRGLAALVPEADGNDFRAAAGGMSEVAAKVGEVRRGLRAAAARPAPALDESSRAFRTGLLAWSVSLVADLEIALAADAARLGRAEALLDGHLQQVLHTIAGPDQLAAEIARLAGGLGATVARAHEATARLGELLEALDRPLPVPGALATLLHGAGLGGERVSALSLIGGIDPTIGSLLAGSKQLCRAISTLDGEFRSIEAALPPLLAASKRLADRRDRAALVDLARQAGPGSRLFAREAHLFDPVFEQTAAARSLAVRLRSGADRTGNPLASEFGARVAHGVEEVLAVAEAPFLAAVRSLNDAASALAGIERAEAAYRTEIAKLAAEARAALDIAPAVAPPSLSAQAAAAPEPGAEAAGARPSGRAAGLYFLRDARFGERLATEMFEAIPGEGDAAERPLRFDDRLAGRCLVRDAAAGVALVWNDIGVCDE